MAESAKKNDLPFYSKYTLILIGIIATCFLLYIGRSIILPFVFSSIIAILLNPLVDWLHKHKVHRVLSIIIALLIAIILLGGLVYFIVWQSSRFGESWPEIKQKFGVLATQAVAWLSGVLNIPPTQITGWFAELKAQSKDNSSAMLGQTLSTLGGMFMVIFIMPIYIFTILYYRPLLMQFVAKLFPTEKHKMVVEVMTESKGLIQSYLVGLLIEAAIVATLNSVGLLIIGVKYAILLGLISALLNLIPYIGIIIATAIPALLALALQSPMSALWVMVLFVAVQFIDNQYIVPYIVASKVKINALISIIIVLIGGALWGISGMFLAIPITAIVKVVFDRIPDLEPIGFLLGDTMPEEGKTIFKIPRRKAAAKK